MGNLLTLVVTDTVILGCGWTVLVITTASSTLGIYLVLLVVVMMNNSPECVLVCWLICRLCVVANLLLLLNKLVI